MTLFFLHIYLLPSFLIFAPPLAYYYNKSTNKNRACVVIGLFVILLLGFCIPWCAVGVMQVVDDTHYCCHRGPATCYQLNSVQSIYISFLDAILTQTS